MNVQVWCHWTLKNLKNFKLKKSLFYDVGNEINIKIKTLQPTTARIKQTCLGWDPIHVLPGYPPTRLLSSGLDFREENFQGFVQVF